MLRKISHILASLALVLVFAHGAFAAAVDNTAARIAAGNYLNYVVSTFHRWENATPTIGSVTAVKYKGDTVFWLAQVYPSGYMLVSPRDELSPVKAYSETGTFDPARVNNPNAPESWMIPMQHQSVVAVMARTKERAAKANASPVATKIAAAWKKFGPGAAISNERTTTVTGTETDGTVKTATSTIGPFITATWGQEAPYNGQTPGISGSCDHTFVGCVPLAWGMLLRHWKWPDRGVGTKTHTWNGQQFTVDFSQQTWRWSEMPDVLNADSPQTQKDAVSKLLYDMGVVAEADWGCSSTGSLLYASSVLDIYFKYKSTMIKRTMGSTDAATWFGYFRTEFDAAPPRPIVMSVFGNAGGHEILADGYQIDATNKVHLNMGWDGSSNAWYDVTSDFTAGVTWTASLSEIVTGIEPDYTQREVNMAPINLLLLQ